MGKGIPGSNLRARRRVGDEAPLSLICSLSNISRRFCLNCVPHEIKIHRPRVVREAMVGETPQSAGSKDCG